MANLVIVESPSKARTIQKYLGKDYDVIASNGHVRDLPKSKLGVDIEKVGDFEKIMKKQLRHEIIHAFLAESGLQANYEHYRQFGHDETLVDWFAIQFPKMIKAFESVNAL